MAEDEENIAAGPICSYLTYKSEGDRLYRRGEYEKAVQSYTLALQREPKNKNCLVARSHCFLLMGNTAAALSDAEASQAESKDFPKGLYRKAESLYAKGEFELALMYYHRGHKLRPDDRLFRLGIQKAQEAIANSVGSPSLVRLDTKGDLSFFYRKEEKVVPKTKSQLRRQKLNLKQPQANLDQVEPKTNRTVRVLLGELYRDKEYLEKLLLDKVFADGRASECMRMATELLDTLRGWTTREVPSKVEFLTHLYNTIGNAQVELGDVEGAMKSYQKDLRISRKYDNTDGISRALDNMGRVYARTGEFEKATEVWLEKEPLTKSSLERTWLFHEIGRCYLELKYHEGARDYGLKSLASAEKAGDEEWKMNSNVLVAQAEFKLGNLQQAMTFFEQALEKANALDDNAAQVAISNALQNVQEEIEIADKAKEEELAEHRRKQRSGRMDVSPVLIERIKTEKTESKGKINFDDGPVPAEESSDQDLLTSTSSDSVCLLPSLSTELHSGAETKGQTGDRGGSAGGAAPVGAAAEAGALKGGAAEGRPEDGEAAETTGRGEETGEGATAEGEAGRGEKEE
ncbi:outer dynein arm-docking complex subunit 4 isoform X6 [Mobula birostris]|uniref:outer dynein arm-docking complex subunit 4 isoform X6 n=1 Tax=Mobula birostris TaxID=1983395 RepID=UPI003B28B3C4